MKRFVPILLPVAALSVAVVGCGDSNESKPVTVTGYTEYVDPLLGFAVRYPKEWAASPAQQGTSALFLSSSQVYDGFMRYTPNGETGAKIQIEAFMGGESALDSAISEFKNNRFEDPGIVKGPEDIQVNGAAAKKLSYTFPVEETNFTAERLYVVNGNVITVLETGVIGNFADYKTVFDSARASFRPGAVAAAPVPTGDTTGGVVRDSIVVDPPAAETKSHSGQGYSVSYPANFNATSAGASGAKSSMRFIGTRIDSYVQIDVLDPKGVELDKIVNETKKNYGGRAPGSATIGGQKGYVFNYSGARDVSSRAYFVMKGSNLYRITVNWFQPQTELYQPAFEKMISSISLK